MADVVIRALEGDEQAAAAAIAARALIDAPSTVAIHGDDRLDRLVTPYDEFSAFFKVLPPPQIGAFCGSCLIGIAAVSAPGGCVGSFLGATAAAILNKPTPGIGDPSRAEVFWAHWASHDLADEHWHIGPVGVEPGFQGRGIGGALLRELCETLDGGTRVGWLETDKERNVRFYQAFGFEVAETLTILGVPTWFLRRDPTTRA